MNVDLRPPARRTTRDALERTFRSHDGAALFFRHWPPSGGGAPAGAVILLHRGHEHGGRMAHLVR
jgi:alpha-beta hydrolase superfamily lysophospholipase